jgi:hypothetical protein
MGDLHIPEYTPHECVPTQDAYDATVRALEKHRKRADRAEEELAAIRDLAYRGTSGDGSRDALEAIHTRACRALNREH